LLNHFLNSLCNLIVLFLNIKMLAKKDALTIYVRLSRKLSGEPHVIWLFNHDHFQYL